MFVSMELWAQRTISPLDGREGWTVVDEHYLEDRHAAQYLQMLVDGEGRSVGAALAYAGRLALYLTWATTSGTEPCAPTLEQLASIARWLEHPPSRKHGPGQNRRRAADPQLLSLEAARSRSGDGLVPQRLASSSLGYMPPGECEELW